MKNSLLVLVCFVLMALGCNQKTSKVSKDDILKNDPLEWLVYKADKPIKKKQIVLVSGDEEYRSEEALPQLAKILSQRHGFECTVLFAQDSKRAGVVNPNNRFNIPGLHLLQNADLVIWFTRFRELPEEQMQFLEHYLKRGKPIIGIRTATHAFNFEDKTHPFVHYGWNYEGEKEEWRLGFGKKVFGETWFTHHGDHKHQSTIGILTEDAENHPILNGIEDGAIWGATDVYGIRTPIEKAEQILVMGKSIDRAGQYDENDLFYGMRETDSIASQTAGPKDNPYNPNEKMPPIVWINTYQLKQGAKGKSLTSTIGAASDMIDPEVRRVLVNASYHLLDLSVPPTADVDTVGLYQPSQFGFHDDAYWQAKNLKVKDLR